jgi:hypothetical protein
MQFGARGNLDDLKNFHHDKYDVKNGPSQDYRAYTA